MPFLKSRSDPASGRASDDLDSPSYSQPVDDPAQESEAEPARLDIDQQLKDLARSIRSAHRKIERSAVVVIASVFSMGHDLVTARDLLAVQGSRGFGRFLKSVKISRSQAHRAIQCHETFGKCPTRDKVELSALYLLSKANTPQPAIDEAVTLTQDQIVTTKMARELIGKHLPERRRITPTPPIVIQVQGGTLALTVEDGLTVEQILLRAIRQIRATDIRAA